ncbi:hypothetical protein EV182_006187, partial [Spiromyces aspiralis]
MSSTEAKRAGLIARLLDIIEEGVGTYYRNSEVGWNSKKKRKELVDPLARYIVICEAGGECPNSIAAFAAFQLSFEETEVNGVERELPIIYCYELHVLPRHQGKGLGTYLMELLQEIGSRWNMQAIFLTVFKENWQALKFYQRLGFKPDPISPSQYLGGKYADNYDYEILSKPLLLDA